MHIILHHVTFANRCSRVYTVATFLSQQYYLKIILSPANPQLRNIHNEPMGAAIAYLASSHFEFGRA